MKALHLCFIVIILSIAAPHSLGQDDPVFTGILTPKVVLNERGGLASILLHRSGSLTVPLTVDLQTEDGSARAGVDYQTVSTNVAFSGSQRTVEIPIINNASRDGTRLFTIRLLNPSAGSLTNSVATVEIHDDDSFGDPGTIDPDFRVDPSFNNIIYDLAVQPDGKIVAAGIFDTPRDNLVRLLPTGETDPTFDTGTGPDSGVEKVYQLGDGKLLIVGSFSSYNGIARESIARLDTNGVLDTSYVASVPNYQLLSTDLQKDGKLIAAGYFNTANGEPAPRLVRFNPDGTIDRSFGAGTNFTFAWPDVVKVQPDGKILIGGGMFKQGSVTRRNLFRLNSDGTLDESFDTRGVAIAPRKLDLFPDGSILAGTSRVFSDGTLDSTFSWPADPFSEPQMLSDGRILAMSTNRNLLLLAADGTIQTNFNFEADYPTIYSQAPGPAGTLYVAGGFIRVNGLVSGSIARLHFDDRTSPARIEWNGQSFGAIEASQSGSLTLIRRGETNTAITVTVRSSAGSADEGADFQKVEQEISFAPGEAQKVLRFPLVNDPHPEADENLAVTVQNPGQPDASAQLQVISDEGFVEFAATDRTASEIEGRVLVELRKIGAAPYVATLPVTVRSEGATNLDYFFPENAIFYINEGRTSLTASVHLFDDTLAEASEVLEFEIGPLTGPHAVGANRIHRLTILDNDDANGAGEGIDASAEALLAPDGGLLLHGAFRTIHGVPRPQLAWLNSAALLLTNPLPQIPGGGVPIQVYPDGGVLAQYTTTTPFPFRAEQTRFIRLLPTGLRDPAFSTNVSFPSVLSALALNDGGVLVRHSGYGFTHLNNAGNIERSFTNHIFQRAGLPGVSAGLQSSGKLVAGGNIFTSNEGPTFAREYRALGLNLVRLNLDGSPDLTFQPIVRGPLEIPAISHLRVLPNDSILIAGALTNVNGQARPGLARVLPGGELDSAFAPDWSPLGNGPIVIESLVPLRDGKLIVQLQANSGSRIVRLDSTGKLDAGFSLDLVTDQPVRSVIELPDGRLALAGAFLSVAGEPRARLAYVSSSGSVLPPYPLAMTLSLSDTGGSVQVSTRSGGEIVLFESADLSDWQPVSTNNLSPGLNSLELPGGAATNHPHRFFKALQGGPVITPSSPEVPLR